MGSKLEKIIKILFSYQTENVGGKINPRILECQKSIGNFLASENIDYKIDEYVIDGAHKDKHTLHHANLLAFNQQSIKPFVLLQGHLDTVPSAIKYNATINKNTIIGRGAVDMKGPLAGLIDAFVQMNKMDNCKYTPMLLITADEESNAFAGINHFLKKYKSLTKKIKIAINGEPTDFEVYTKFRGIFGHDIFVNGKSGHSAYPGDGTIIEKMIPLVDKVNYFIEESRKIDDDAFGETIGAFTMLNAGNKINQLPADFSLGYALRIVKQVGVYDALFSKIVGDKFLRDVQIKKISIDPIDAHINEKENRYLRESFQKININFTTDVARYFSEANILNRNNIKTITCGPGNPQLAHVDPELEKININDIEKYSQLVQSIFMNYK